VEKLADSFSTGRVLWGLHWSDCKEKVGKSWKSPKGTAGWHNSDPAIEDIAALNSYDLQKYALVLTDGRPQGF